MLLLAQHNDNQGNQNEGYLSKDSHLKAADKNHLEQSKEVFSIVE
jgi:hypothetical protein